jgi:hypothetical protein
MTQTRTEGIRACLHLGPEKTGTSFLQCLCVRNRALLDRNGIHFPVGTPHDESAMHSARISAGNGRTLADLVESNDWAGAGHWLEQSIAKARDAQAQRLLISSEQLLAPLASPGRLVRFMQVMQGAGINDVMLLLILRDPVSQLLSLYKHRAKSGSAGRIQDWVENGYQLPSHLASLARQVDETDATLQVRGYTRQPGGLENLFLREWLELDELPQAGEIEVNPSLSLSELELIRRMNEQRPELVPFLRERLSAVLRKDKVQGSALKAHAHAVAEDAVWQHREDWARWNAILPEGERLSVPESAPEIPETPEELEFSTRQVEELARFMAEAARPRFLAQVWWRGWIRPRLGWLKRRLMG